MMNKIVLGSLVLAGILVGCGSVSESGYHPSIDNSQNTEFKNNYGYYGEKVIFGNDLVVGDWVIAVKFDSEDTFYPSLEIELFDDATAYTQDRYRIQGKYGVSKDGQILRLSKVFDVRIVLKKTITKGDKSIDCYVVDTKSPAKNITTCICPMDFHEFGEKFGRG